MDQLRRELFDVFTRTAVNTDDSGRLLTGDSLTIKTAMMTFGGSVFSAAACNQGRSSAHARNAGKRNWNRVRPIIHT